jgi:SAM-dependent methyltransferase
MPMNLMHRKLCASRRWARTVADALPGWLAGIDLGEDVLEIGPGFGATTRVLVDRVPRLTALEIDEASVRGLRAEFEGRVAVVHGDGGSMPFPDGRFSSVVCFTMLHHVPSRRAQDRLFGEARRVLRPGGLLRGVDSQPSLPSRLLHLGDTMVVVDPRTLPGRLTDAGFRSPQVHVEAGRLFFLARVAAPTG